MGFLINLIVLLFSYTLNSSAAIEPGILPAEVAAKHLEIFLQERPKILKKDFFGHQITAEEYDASIFEIPTIKIIQALPTEPEVKRIFQFLDKNNFINHAGRIYTKSLLDLNKKDPKFTPAKKKLQGDLLKQIGDNLATVGEGSSVNYVIIDSDAQNYDRYVYCLIIRAENGVVSDLSKIDPSLQPFFVENQDAKNLLERASELLVDIQERLNRVKAIAYKKNNEQNFVEELLDSDDFPSLLKPRIRKAFNKFGKAAIDLKQFKLSLEEALTILGERQNSIRNIFPSSLGIALLYSFFLLEESHAPSEKDPDGQKKPVEKDGGILNAYGASDEDLSLRALFESMGLDILQELGFDKKPNQPNNASARQAEASNLKSNNDAKTKKPSSRRSIARQKKPQGSKSWSQAGTQNKNAGESLPTQGPSVEVPVLQELHDHPLVGVDEDEEKSPELKDVPHPHQLEQARGLVLNSLNDPKLRNNVMLRQERGHHLLDIIARLLAYELADGHYKAAGTVALALVNRDGQDRLAIATKNRVHADYIIEALENAVNNSQLETLAGDIAERLTRNNSAARRAQQIIASSEEGYTRENLMDFYRSRARVHRLRLAQALQQPEAHDPLVERITKLLLNKNLEDSVIVLSNPFSMHAELKVAEYIRDRRLALGSISLSANKNVRYQYIGCSLLNCAMCHAVIHGGDAKLNCFNDDQTQILFFSRGHYDLTYPGFVVPISYAHQNEQPCRLLRDRLHRLAPQADLRNTVGCQYEDGLSDED